MLMMEIREQLCTASSAPCWIEDIFASKSLSTHIRVTVWVNLFRCLFLTHWHRCPNETSRRFSGVNFRRNLREMFAAREAETIWSPLNSNGFIANCARVGLNKLSEMFAVCARWIQFALHAFAHNLPLNLFHSFVYITKFFTRSKQQRKVENYEKNPPAQTTTTTGCV